MSDNMQTRSVLTCPVCGHRAELEMPVDACQFFHECSHCHSVLRPLPGDCCVFCSYGTVKCPSMQQPEVNGPAGAGGCCG
ncbi:MAG TPA: GDCCVxC domain-containing (seleno)protein [Acidovorax sp.]|nr:GDCCVxC domain-containing (seleno)protein [Acidovorax sp.]